MSDGSPVVSSLPDAPLSRSGVAKIDSASGVRRAICPTWQTQIQGSGEEICEDLIVITDSRVTYLSRELDEGWVVKRDESYADDEEFEVVMDDVHDFACEYSEKRIQEQVQEQRSK
jgi:hypothetical protein